jgi:hypothetical protein
LSRFLLGLIVTVLAAAACADTLRPETGSTNRLVVAFAPGSMVGSAATPIDLSFTNTQTYTLTVTAQKADGTTDASFNSFVRLSIVPGTVVSVTGPNTSGRNVQLMQGTASNVQVTVLAAYGNARIWVEDLGYVPADPMGAKPPQCANGLDDNNNGLIDYPTDPGCYLANDDTEDGGTYATGVSDTIFYRYPRVADVRGVSQGGGATSFPNQQVEIDTQWSLPIAGPGQTVDTRPTGVVVTGLSSSGFYVTDVADTRGYASVFAYNYVAPTNMFVCDRLVGFGGTSSDFYGWTEINYPAWELEEWDPTTRCCFVPEPHVFSVAELGSTPSRLMQESGLVRVRQNPMPAGYDVADPCNPSGADESALGSTPYSLHISSLIGPNHPAPPAYTPTADATNCDLNGDGKITFTAGDPEDTCSVACSANPECSEYSAFLSQQQFNLVLVSGSVTTYALADGAASQTFNPVDVKGMSVSSFTGNLRYFSGGTQFTITARCSDDIVMDTTKPPLPSDKACVTARTIADQPTF